MQTKEELNLADAIKGEINRMCVTNDIAELDTMALHARKNIERLQSLDGWLCRLHTEGRLSVEVR